LQLLIVSAHIEKTIRTFVGYPVLDLFFRKLLSSYRASNGIAQYLRGGILEQNDERESPMDLSFRFNVPTGLEV
jgi:hypothetical protein